MAEEESIGRVSLDALLEHRDWVRALARSLVHDRNRADDVEQETWRMALERPPQHGSSLRAWFGTVVRRAVRRSARREAQRARLDSSVPLPRQVPSPEDVTAQADLHATLVRAVVELGEPYSSTVLYRFFHGLTPTEIAARLHVPVETVKTRLKRSIERLRKQMDDDLGEDRDAWCLLVLGYRPSPVGLPTGAALAQAAGGMVMAGTATKAAAAGVVLVLLLAAGWMWKESATSTRGTAVDGDSDSRKTAGSPAGSSRPRRRAEAAPVVPEHGAAIVGTDRDRDLAGIVVDDAGAPVAGAVLQVVEHPWMRSGLASEIWAMMDRTGAATTSAADGTFSIRLRRGQSVNLRASAAGFATMELVQRAAGERVRVVLAKPVTLVVSLVREGGGPAPEVGVTALTWPPSDEPRVMRTARSAEDGTIRFDALPPNVKLHVHPDGWMEGGEVTLPASGTANLELIVVRGRTLDGRVTNVVTGDGIAGARIGGEVPVFGAVTSDADGNFRLVDWMSEDRKELHCRASGYARGVMRPGSAERIAFALQPEVRITGRIVDAAARPVTGAMVTAVYVRPVANVVTREEPDAPRPSPKPYSEAHVVEDAEGRFVLAELAGDLPHRLVVVASGHAIFSRTLDPVAPEKVRDLGDVVLEPPRAIAGTFVVDGEPVRRALVLLRDTNGVDPPWSGEKRWTDDMGRFRYDDLAPGVYVVSTSAPGLDRVELKVTLPPDRDVTDLVFGPPQPDAADRRITVHVVDEHGAPVLGAQVEVSGWRWLKRPKNALTDTAGITRFDVPRARLDVSVQPPGKDGRLWIRDLASYGKILPDREELTLTLKPGAAIDGVLLDSNQRPVADAFVTLRWGPGYTSLESTGAQTDENGRFTAVVPTHGTITVEFRGQSMPRDSPSNKRDVIDTRLYARLDGVAPGTRGLVLRAERIPENRTLQVRVLSPDGVPIAGTTVTARDPLVSNDPRTYVPNKATTDADGRANLSGLLGRPHGIGAASTAGFFRAWITDVIPDGREVTITLRRAATISGTIVAAEGHPLAKGVGVYREDGETHVLGDTIEFTDDGRFTILISADEPGPFKLRAALPPQSRKVPAPPYEIQVEGEVEGVQPGATNVRIVMRVVEMP